MAEEQQGQGFVVRDRRAFSRDENQEVAGESSGQEPKAQKQEPQDSQKQRPKEEPREIPLPQPTFSGFLASFFLPQVLTFLGEIPNPETQQRERNLPMAKYLIDTLGIIQEKTKGNLTSEEKKHLEGLLTDLRLLYVKAVKI
jgi:hypothetical protein